MYKPFIYVSLKFFFHHSAEATASFLDSIFLRPDPPKYNFLCDSGLALLERDFQRFAFHFVFRLCKIQTLFQNCFHSFFSSKQMLRFDAPAIPLLPQVFLFVVVFTNMFFFPLPSHVKPKDVASKQQQCSCCFHCNFPCFVLKQLLSFLSCRICQ